MKKSVIIIVIDIVLLSVAILLGLYAVKGMKERRQESASTDYSAEESFDNVQNANEEAVDEENKDSLEEASNENEEAAKETLPATIVFTGDLEISTYVQDNYDASGWEGVVSADLQKLCSDATFSMVNNEFCYSTRGEKAPDKQYTFRVDPSYVQLLCDLGVDIAGLANNHVLDYGKDALTDTFATLGAAEIEYTGSGTSLEDARKLIVKEYDGKKYGFLAASRVIPVGSWNVEASAPGVFCCYDPGKLREDIASAKLKCDYVFVMVHWGVEHTDKLEDYQINMGHSFIDEGADGVIGMHSHCLQPVEFYNGKPIFYSLGNFIFNRDIKSAAVVRCTIQEDETLKWEVLPTAASGAKTYLSEGEQKQGVLDYLGSISPTVVFEADGHIREAGKL